MPLVSTAQKCINELGSLSPVALPDCRKAPEQDEASNWIALSAWWLRVLFNQNFKNGWLPLVSISTNQIRGTNCEKKACAKKSTRNWTAGFSRPCVPFTMACRHFGVTRFLTTTAMFEGPQIHRAPPIASSGALQGPSRMSQRYEICKLNSAHGCGSKLG